MPVRSLSDAGWRPDPAGTDDTWRWWTGTRWTAWLTDDPQAPPPPLPSPEGEAAADPRAAAEVEPRMPSRFGTGARTLMALVAVGILLAAVVVAGAPYGQRIALTAPIPTSSYVPPDLSVTCADRLWVVAGQVRVDPPPDMIVSGPDVSDTLGILRCRAQLDGEGGNGMAVFGLGDALVEGETVEDRADVVATQLAETVYTAGPVEWIDRTAGPSELGEDTWQITGGMRGLPAAEGSRAELVVIPLSSGHVAIWFHVLGGTLDQQGRDQYDDFRASLVRE